MVQIKRMRVRGVTYLSAYHGSKFLKYLGREDRYTEEELLFIKRELGEKNADKRSKARNNR